MKTQPLLLSLLVMLATCLSASAGTAFLEKGNNVPMSNVIKNAVLLAEPGKSLPFTSGTKGVEITLPAALPDRNATVVAMCLPSAIKPRGAHSQARANGPTIRSSNLPLATTPIEATLLTVPQSRQTDSNINPMNRRRASVGDPRRGVAESSPESFNPKTIPHEAKSFYANHPIRCYQRRTFRRCHGMDSSHGPVRQL